MIKRLDRVKRVPKMATNYFTLFLTKLIIKLKEANVDTRADILIVDTEKGYVYFNIEAWSTLKFTLRLSDMLVVREGRDLLNPIMGWHVESLLEMTFDNLSNWDRLIKLSDSIDKSKQFIINRDTVVEYESNAPHGGGVYLVEFEADPKPQCMMAPWLQSEKQEWYGYNHEDAVSAALQYQPNRKPLKVTFVRAEKF